MEPWNVLVAVALLTAYASPCLGVQFEFPAFRSISDVSPNIKFANQSWYNTTEVAFSDSAIWLTPSYASEDGSNLGRIVYKDPISFVVDEHDTISPFSTSFTFQIITTRPYGTCGSGMAFFISDTVEAPPQSDQRGAIGLLNPSTTSSGGNNFFAVEFDTRKSSTFQDPSASHIGIDLNTLVSANTTDTSPGSRFPELNLYNNYTFTAWVEYNSSTNLIQVWMVNTTSHERPPEPCLQLNADLSQILGNGPMYVGFSATSAPASQGPEGHAIYAWNFSSKSATSSCKFCTTRRLLILVLPPAIFLVLVFLIISAFAWKRFAYGATNPPPNISRSLELALRTVPRYTYKDLRRATRGFSEKEKIGEGGFSIVYKGMLADGSAVAVKKLKESLRKEVDFCTEIAIICKTRHRNLLELQGWCHENGQALLVYKYMANGSLDKYLYGAKRGKMEEGTRFRVLLGVAGALEYLHSCLGDCVLHRDVKAANVLLADDFEPMLSDFGLARLIHHNQEVSITAAGTPGFVAPEVVYMGRATDKADVYSFGLLAMEVACGKRVLESNSAGTMPLVDLVWSLHENDMLLEALDPNMGIDITSSAGHRWSCVLHMAMLCCHPSPESRPNMRQVLQTLQGEKLLSTLPKARPFNPYWRVVEPHPSSQSSFGDKDSGFLSAR